MEEIPSKISIPIPIGYRFLPTKEEVLNYYLRPAIHGEQLPCDVLIEGDIYGDNKEPWKLFDKDSPCSLWVFTKLKRKSKAKIDRIAGCGCWLNRATKEVHDSNGKLIGFDKYFTFTCKKEGSSQGNNGNWIMHEYSLSEEGSTDYVICEIRNKDAEDEGTGNKKRKTSSSVAADGADDVSHEAVAKRFCGNFDHEEHPMNYHEQNMHDQLSNNPIMHQSLSSCCGITEEMRVNLEVTSASASVNLHEQINNDQDLRENTMMHQRHQGNIVELLPVQFEEVTSTLGPINVDDHGSADEGWFQDVIDFEDEPAFDWEQYLLNYSCCV